MTSPDRRLRGVTRPEGCLENGIPVGRGVSLSSSLPARAIKKAKKDLNEIRLNNEILKGRMKQRHIFLKINRTIR